MGSTKSPGKTGPVSDPFCAWDAFINKNRQREEEGPQGLSDIGMLAWQRYFYKTCCSCVTNSSTEERDMPRVEIPAEEVFPVLKENILEDGFHAVIDL